MVIVKKRFMTIAAMFCIAGASTAAAKTDRYIGYYYPALSSSESYCARADTLPEIDKRRRIGFTIGIKAGMATKSYAPEFTLFAKGDRAHKMIIIAKRDGYLGSIYRVRALLADLTTNARTTPAFEKSGTPEGLTFLDLAVMLGFESVTVSDGAEFTHQIDLNSKSVMACADQNTND